MSARIVADYTELATALAGERQGREVALTNGCFDLLHVGHVRLIRAARREGDILVVALNDDAGARDKAIIAVYRMRRSPSQSCETIFSTEPEEGWFLVSASSARRRTNGSLSSRRCSTMYSARGRSLRMPMSHAACPRISKCESRASCRRRASGML